MATAESLLSCSRNCLCQIKSLKACCGIQEVLRRRKAFLMAMAEILRRRRAIIAGLQTLPHPDPSVAGQHQGLLQCTKSTLPVVCQCKHLVEDGAFDGGLE